MSQSVIHRLQHAVVAHLQASPLLAGIPVSVNRSRPVSQGVAAAIDVRLGASRSTAPGYSYNEWTTVVAIDCMARTAAGKEAHATADGLLAACYAAMHDFAGTSAAGALCVFDVEDASIEPGFDAEDTALAVLTLQLPIRHETLQNALEPRP